MNTCCDTMTTNAGATASGSTPAYRPRLDVIETPEAFRLEIEVPGAGKDDVELKFEKRFLVVTATVPARDGDGRRYHVREHGPRTLVRRIGLGDTIDTAGIAAEVRNGLLAVTLPKVAAARPRRIEIA